MHPTRLPSIPRSAHLARHQQGSPVSKTLCVSQSAIARVVLALALLGVVASPSAAKDTMADCTKFVDGWKAAYNAKDADALASIYEPKKGTYSNVFWTGTGHDVLVNGFKQELGMGSTMTSIKCEASSASGDLVVSKGTWSASSPGSDGKAMTIGGHWQSSAVGHAGKYLISDHTSNMQLPPK